MNDAHYTAIGIDVSDRKSRVCVMTKAGGSPKVVLETSVPTTKEGLSKFLATQDKASPVTFETGAHCRRMGDVASAAGFRVFVANPCRLRMITESRTKNDADDTDLKAKGLRICRRGAKTARRKAVTAVAGSLAVMMVAMPRKPERARVPLPERAKKALEAMRAVA